MINIFLVIILITLLVVQVVAGWFLFNFMWIALSFINAISDKMLDKISNINKKRIV